MGGIKRLGCGGCGLQRRVSFSIGELFGVECYMWRSSCMIISVATLLVLLQSLDLSTDLVQYTLPKLSLHVPHLDFLLRSGA